MRVQLQPTHKRSPLGELRIEAGGQSGERQWRRQDGGHGVGVAGLVGVQGVCSAAASSDDDDTSMLTHIQT